jgi:pilus assembly protein CpaF
VHTERRRDGIRRVQKIAEVGGVGGDAISLRDLFTFEYRGERRDGTIEGAYEPSRARPDIAARAVQFGLEKPLLDALGIAV